MAYVDDYQFRLFGGSKIKIGPDDCSPLVPWLKQIFSYIGASTFLPAPSFGDLSSTCLFIRGTRHFAVCHSLTVQGISLCLFMLCDGEWQNRNIVSRISLVLHPFFLFFTLSPHLAICLAVTSSPLPLTGVGFWQQPSRIQCSRQSDAPRPRYDVDNMPDIKLQQSITRSINQPISFSQCVRQSRVHLIDHYVNNLVGLWICGRHLKRENVNNF